MRYIGLISIFDVEMKTDSPFVQLSLTYGGSVQAERC